MKNHILITIITLPILTANHHTLCVTVPAVHFGPNVSQEFSKDRALTGALQHIEGAYKQLRSNPVLETPNYDALIATVAALKSTIPGGDSRQTFTEYIQLLQPIAKKLSTTIQTVQEQQKPLAGMIQGTSEYRDQVIRIRTTFDDLDGILRELLGLDVKTADKIKRVKNGPLLSYARPKNAFAFQVLRKLIEVMVAHVKTLRALGDRMFPESLTF